MDIVLFIFFVICICRGLRDLTSENPISDSWAFILLDVLLVVCGCAGAGVALFNLVQQFCKH